MSDFLIFKAAFNNSVTPVIGTYTAEGATASFTQNASLSPDYYLYNPNASITAVQWFVPTAETTDFEFVADILTDDRSLDGDRYFIIADSTGTTGLCMLSSSSITEWRFMNGDGTATSDPEYVGAIDPATSGGFGVFHQFRIRVRKLTASSSSVEVYVDGTLKLTATAGAALVTCAKIGFIGGVTDSPSTDSGIKNAYVYDLSGGDVITRGVLSGAFNRLINWAKNDSGFIATEEQGEGYIRYSNGLQICWGAINWQSACKTAWGSLYETSSIRESYARSFAEIPSFSASGEIGSFSAVMEFLGGSQTSTPNIYLVRGATVSNVVTCTARYIAIGRWK